MSNRRKRAALARKLAADQTAKELEVKHLAEKKAKEAKELAEKAKRQKEQESKRKSKRSKKSEE